MFWYVNEYLPVSSSYGWYTRIGSFKFSGCGQAPSPDFSLSANPSSLTLTQGNPASSTITVNSISGFTGNVGLTAAGCPANATCTLIPASVNPAGASASSTLTVTTDANTPAASYNLVVSGNGNNVTHTTNVSLTVTQPDFAISLSAAKLDIPRGSQKSLTVNTTGAGGSVTLSVSELHQKSTASFSLNPIAAGGSSVLTISASPGAKRETYTVTVTGTNGVYTHSTAFDLTIN